MSIPKIDDRYTKKDWYICEQCHHTNVVNINKVPRFEKKKRMMYVEDAVWNTFKGLAGEYGMNHAAFLAFLIGIIQREKISYDTARS